MSSLGYYLRPFQDDFYYYPPRDHGELVALLNERYNWTGRFTSTTLHLLVGWTESFWIVPTISFLLMTTGIFSICRMFLRSFIHTVHYNNLALFLSGILTLVIFLVTPSPYSSMFWLSGAPIHFWSYGLILLYLAYFLKRLNDHQNRLKIYDYIFMTIIPLIIGMMGEVAMFTLVAIIGSLLAYVKFYKSTKIIQFILPNLVGLSIAFFALFFSTGAMIRRESEASLPTSEVIAHAPFVVISNFYALTTSLLNNKFVLILVLLAALLLGMSMNFKNAKLRRVFIIGLITTVIGIGLMSLNFVGVYASVQLDVAWSRTQAFSVIIIISLLMFYGVFCGLAVRRYLSKHQLPHWINRMKIVLVVLGLLIVVMNMAYIPYIARFTDDIRQRAILYDRREDYLSRLSNQDSVTCPIRLPTTYLVGTQEKFDLLPDEKHALNIGVERYYHLPCHVVGE